MKFIVVDRSLEVEKRMKPRIYRVIDINERVWWYVDFVSVGRLGYSFRQYTWKQALDLLSSLYEQGVVLR